MHVYATGLIDGSGNGVLASTSGDYITDVPPLLVVVHRRLFQHAKEPGTTGGTTVVGTTEGGNLIGAPLIGAELAG